MKNGSSYFKNEACEFFPCHKTDGKDFNCLFCYCPLYSLGENCGGNFIYNESGIKDCSECLIPHSEKGYDFVTAKCGEICKALKEVKNEL